MVATILAPAPALVPAVYAPAVVPHPVAPAACPTPAPGTPSADMPALQASYELQRSIARFREAKAIHDAEGKRFQEAYSAMAPYFAPAAPDATHVPVQDLEALRQEIRSLKGDIANLQGWSVKFKADLEDVQKRLPPARPPSKPSE